MQPLAQQRCAARGIPVDRLQELRFFPKQRIAHFGVLIPVNVTEPGFPGGVLSDYIAAFVPAVAAFVYVFSVSGHWHNLIWTVGNVAAVTADAPDGDSDGLSGGGKNAEKLGAAAVEGGRAVECCAGFSKN